MSSKGYCDRQSITSLGLAAQTSLWVPYGCTTKEVCICMAELAELAPGTSLLQGPELARTETVCCCLRSRGMEIH